MKNLKIGKRLAIVFGLIVLIFAVFGLYSIKRMEDIAFRTENIYLHPFAVTNAVSTIRADFNLMRKYLVEARLATSKKEVKRSRVEIDKLEKLIFANVDIIEKQFLGDKTWIADFKTQYEEWKLVRDDVIDVIDETNPKDFKNRVNAEYRRNESIDQIKDITAILLKIETFASNKAKSMYDESNTLTNQARQATYILFVILVVLIIIIVLSITNSLVNGIKKMVVAAQKITAGDFNVTLDLNQNDEVGILAQTFKEMIQKLRISVQLAQNVSVGDVSGMIDNRRLEGKGELDYALMKMVDQLKQIVLKIVEASENVASGSTELSNTATQVAQGANEQASSAEEISVSITEMTETIQQNSKNAFQTEKIANESVQGIIDVSKATFRSLNATKDIVTKILIINEIAEKIDILAINAAIEAARAGEYGKGFAVVAAEVRKLSEISQNAAKEINELSRTNLTLNEESNKMLQEMIPNIKKTAQLVQEISSASSEQSSGTTQILKAIQQFTQVIQQNSAAAEQMSSGSEELSGQAEILKEVISFFKVEKHNQRNVSKSQNTEIYFDTPKKTGVKIHLGDEVTDNEFEKIAD